MKIVEASVIPWNDGYKAVVCLLDEGLTYRGEYIKKDATEALHAAASVAYDQVTSLIHKSLTIKHEVTF